MSSLYKMFRLEIASSSIVRKSVTSDLSSILIHSGLTDSGHGHQVPCRHHTEPDGLDEGSYLMNPTASIICNMNH